MVAGYKEIALIVLSLDLGRQAPSALFGPLALLGPVNSNTSGLGGWVVSFVRINLVRSDYHPEVYF